MLTNKIVAVKTVFTPLFKDLKKCMFSVDLPPEQDGYPDDDNEGYL